SRLTGRLKKGLNSGLNHLEIIELQSDPRYGHLFVHEPAQAEVTIQADPSMPGLIHVQVDDFLSPTVVQRLRGQSRIEPMLIEDWRAMVDHIAIDPAYDGVTLRAQLADAPHKRTDIVQGRYQLQGISLPTTVAVRITDMLGEEVLVIRRVNEI
ncbi:MAG: hypothetical protein KDE31_24745, partial [Caldilineaceae bacterium]|nr:hypothetical protein [Caldilineaceae bacterium]